MLTTTHSPHSPTSIQMNFQSSDSSSPPTSAMMRFFIIAALVSVQLISAVHTIFSRIALRDDVEPAIFTFLRVAIGIPILFTFDYFEVKVKKINQHHLLDKSPKRSKLRTIFDLFHIGFWGVTVNLLCFGYGLQLTNASISGISNATVPVISSAISMILRREKVTKLKLICIALAVSGALVMIDVSDFEGGINEGLGLMNVFLSAIGYSILLVIQEPLLEWLPASYILAYSSLYGFIGISVAALARYQYFKDLPTFDWQIWLIIVFSAVFNVAIQNSLNSYAVKHSSPVTSGLFTTLRPVFTVILAIVFLSETVSFLQWTGSAIILAAVFVIVLARHKESKTEEEHESDEQKTDF